MIRHRNLHREATMTNLTRQPASFAPDRTITTRTGRR